jgi:hypothetical protein
MNLAQFLPLLFNCFDSFALPFLFFFSLSFSPAYLEALKRRKLFFFFNLFVQ